MLALFVLGSALAGPLGDLAGAAGGTPIVAMRCDHASRVVGGDGQFGLAVVGEMPAEDSSRLFDLDKPLAIVMSANEAGDMVLAVEGGASDPASLPVRLEDPAVVGMLPEGATITAVEDRVRMLLPQGPGGEPSGQPVVELAEEELVSGCVVAVDAPALFAGSPPPIPLADRMRTIVARMEDPRGEHRITVTLADVPPEVVGVLDGQGPVGLAGVSSTVVFPTVMQIHGTIGEVLRALPAVSQGPATAVAASLADTIDGKLVGDAGILVALGGPEEGGALVLPMVKPKSPGKLRKVVAKVGKEIGADVTKQPGGMLSLGIGGRPPLMAGAGKGLVVVALRDDVVRDVLAGQGEPWLPAAAAPYGLRMRGAAGALSLGGFEGYVEAIWADGALQLVVQPAR